MFFVDEVKCRIFMEQIQGHSVKHFLRTVISGRAKRHQLYVLSERSGELLKVIAVTRQKRTTR